jgi:hypothetical protein
MRYASLSVAIVVGVLGACNPPADTTPGAVAPAPPGTRTPVAEVSSAGPAPEPEAAGADAASPSPGANANAKSPRSCFSAQQVLQFVFTHRAEIQRPCWEQQDNSRLAAKVSVTLTVDPDGNVHDVSATGDDDAIAVCVANAVRNWRFPDMGCSQRMNIPFQFERR